MAFTNNQVIEIEASTYRATARVRNVMGDRLHVALENGYLPWIDEPVLVRHLGDASAPFLDARILHTSGPTAMIELIEVTPSAASSDRLPPVRDTMTDEG